MDDTRNLEIISYPEQIYLFRKNIFILRSLFYLIMTLTVILPVSEHVFPLYTVIICGLLFLLNLVSTFAIIHKKLNITALLLIQQCINIGVIVFLIFLTGKGHSVFIILFIIEGFFCGILYSSVCVIGSFIILITSSIYFLMTDYGYNYTLILSIILSIFATVTSFFIIREQDKNKIELISYYLKLEKLNARLIGIGRLRKNFMDIAYHDMKSPISTVIGFLQNIICGYGGPVTEKQQEWINRCIDRLDALSKQINDLYFLANIESTDFNELKKRCDVVHEFELAIAEVSEKFAKKNQRFIRNIPPSVPWVVVVPILFRHCIINLLGNASKYTPTGGTIELDVTYDDNWLIVRVSDNGIGIPDEFKPRVFDEFFRVKNTVVDNQKVKGTGLGLTIVKSIIDGHGGTIDIQNNIPNGTMFVVKFPLIKEYKEA